MNTNTITQSLQYLVQVPVNGIQSSTPTLILLHGVGSNEKDLFRLKDQLPANALIISAQAPMAMGPGKYGWYEVDFSTGKPVYNAAQELNSREKILAFLDEIVNQYKVDRQKIFLIGFSQGAIMSFTIALNTPKKIGGIIALSGRILKEAKTTIATEAALKSVKVMIAHGTNDQILPIQHARESKAFLQHRFPNFHYKEYPIGHQISEEVIRDIQEFLAKY